MVSDTSIRYKYNLSNFGGALIQLSRNAMGGGGIRVKMEISVTKVYGPTILTLPGGLRVSNFQKRALCNT